MRRRSDSVLSGLIEPAGVGLAVVRSGHAPDAGVAGVAAGPSRRGADAGTRRATQAQADRASAHRVLGGAGRLQAIGNDEVLFLGTELGKAPFLGWFTNGKRVTFLVNVVPAKGPRPVPATSEQRGDVTVFEFNEELAEITETREVDGGIVIRGKNRKGLGIEVMLTPKK